MSVAKEKFVMPHFNPEVFSSEAAKAFWALLEVGSYRHSLRLPRPSNHYGLSEPSIFLDYFRKRTNCWGNSASARIYRNLLQREKGPAPVYLFDLLWLAQPIQERLLLELIGKDQLEVLINASVLSRRNDLVYATIRCIALPNLYAMFDIDRGSTGNFVYFGTDSRDMVKIILDVCAGRKFGRSIDLCTGSGVQGLTLAGRSEEVICTDINERALSLVQANALLNGLTNVRSQESNLFSNITGRFDCVTANTPYVPQPEDPNALDLPQRGGDLGIEFTFELIEQMLDHWNPGGIAVIYTSDPILKTGPFMSLEIPRKFGHLSLDFTLLQIFRTYPNTKRQQQHFQKHKMVAFDDCVLIIRHSSRFSFRQHAWRPLFYWRTKLLRTEFSSDPSC